MDAAFKMYGQMGVDVVKTGYVADMGGIIAPGDKPARPAWNIMMVERMAHIT